MKLPEPPLSDLKTATSPSSSHMATMLKPGQPDVVSGHPLIETNMSFLEVWSSLNENTQEFLDDQFRTASHMNHGILGTNSYFESRDGPVGPHLENYSMASDPVIASESSTPTATPSSGRSTSGSTSSRATKQGLDKSNLKLPRGRPRLKISAAEVVDVYHTTTLLLHGC